MPRPRRAVAVACIALVVVTAILPLGGTSFDWLVVPPAFVQLPALSPAARLLVLVCPDEQPIALVGTFDPRGPPQSSLA